MNMPNKDVVGRVNEWYSEVENCDRFPGCEKSKTPGKHVGHFTAMIWKGVKEIGCATHKGSNGAWYYVCRYASGPKLSFETANMGGGYKKNVFQQSKDQAPCERAIAEYEGKELPPLQGE